MQHAYYALFGAGDAGVLVPPGRQPPTGRGTQARRLLPYVQEYTQDGHMLLAGIPTTVALAGAGVLTNTHKG